MNDNKQERTHCNCGHDHCHDHENDHCNCGSEHSHENDHCNCGSEHSHEHDHCNCGHDHCHDHENDHCNCGHDHAHEHEDSHEKGHSCGCAMCQLEDLTGLAEEAEEEEEHHIEVGGCGCGHCHEDHDEEKKKLTMPLQFLLTGGVLALTLLPLPKLVIGGLYLALILLWGFSVIQQGFEGIKRRSLDENTLMTIAVLAAFLLGEYFEALMVVILFSIGEILEDKAVQRSRKDIAQVVNIRPQKANLVTASGEVKVIPSKNLKLGDRIQIKAGERVPVDGVILKGQSMMDRSAITGESVAIGVQEGDRVISGEVNLSGVLECRCETTYENSTASRIIQLVEESTAQKGQTEKFITRFAKYYTPAVVVLAAITAFVPPLAGFGSFSMWISRALVFLVTSCPCALVISVPLTFFSGVGAISKQGVLVKGTKFLEPLSKVKNVVFDKTGTITTGELTVSEIKVVSDAYDMRAITSLAESFSSHPVAKAVCKFFGSSTIDPSQASQVEEMAGKGIAFVLDGKQVLCGSARLMKENGVDLTDAPEANVYTAVDKTLIGCVMLSDIPRADAADTLKKLKAMGVERTVMLTGDSAVSAQVVKREVGVDELHCNLMPQDKATILSDMKKNGGITVFVGDGINDAPVIAAADVGFAMGLGTDAAVESADAVLMSDSLAALPKALETARRTMAIVKFNVAFIFLAKLAVIILGVMGIAPMWLAVFADVGVSVITILNGVRILKVKKED